MPSLDDIAAGIAMGLLDSSSLMTAATRQMRCRRHGAAIVAFGGPQGAMCERCIADAYPPAAPTPEDVTAPTWERFLSWGRARRGST